MQKIQLTISFFILSLNLLFSQNEVDSINNCILNQIPNKISIIGLGDPTHQEGTITNYRIDLIKKLVLHKDFKIIAVEGNLFEFYNSHKDFLENGEVSNYEKAQYKMLNTDEMQPLYQFVYEQNKKGNSVKLIGFDPHFSGKTYVSRIKNKLKNINILSEKEKDDFVKFLRKANITNLKAIFRNNNKVKTKIVYYSNKLLESFEPKDEDDFFFQNSLNNIVNLYSENNVKDNRDLAMANNIEFIQEMYPNQKIILFGSSTHLLKNPKEIQSFFFQNKRTTTLGNELNLKYGDKYYYIAYTSLSGFKFNAFRQKKPLELNYPVENSIESIFIKENESSFFLTSKSFPLNEKIESRFMGHSFLSLNLWQIMDGLVLIKNTEPF